MTRHKNGDNVRVVQTTLQELLVEPTPKPVDATVAGIKSSILGVFRFLGKKWNEVFDEFGHALRAQTIMVRALAFPPFL